MTPERSLPPPHVWMQTAKGWEQAVDAGEKLRALLQAESKGRNFRLFFYTSPYLRCKQVGGWLEKCTPEAWRLVGSGVWVCLLSQHQPCAASRHVPVG